MRGPADVIVAPWGGASVQEVAILDALNDVVLAHRRICTADAELASLVSRPLLPVSQVA